MAVRNQLSYPLVRRKSVPCRIHAVLEASAWPRHILALPLNLSASVNRHPCPRQKVSRRGAAAVGDPVVRSLCFRRRLPLRTTRRLTPPHTPRLQLARLLPLRAPSRRGQAFPSQSQLVLLSLQGHSRDRTRRAPSASAHPGGFQGPASPPPSKPAARCPAPARRASPRERARERTGCSLALAAALWFPRRADAPAARRLRGSRTRTLTSRRCCIAGRPPVALAADAAA